MIELGRASPPAVSDTRGVTAEPVLDPSTHLEVTLESIREAAAAIRPYVVRTPTVRLDRMAELLGRPLVGKLELLQHTGAFKARGAFNRMLHLTDDEVASGVVAVSGGNHGLAVAYAARELGIAGDGADALHDRRRLGAAGPGRRSRGGHRRDDRRRLRAGGARGRGRQGDDPPVRRPGGDRRSGHVGAGAVRGRAGRHRRDRLHRWRRHDHRRRDRAQGSRSGHPDLGRRDGRRRRHDSVAARPANR